jgi:hypothetical protein
MFIYLYFNLALEYFIPNYTNVLLSRQVEFPTSQNNQSSTVPPNEERLPVCEAAFEEDAQSDVWIYGLEWNHYTRQRLVG